MSPDLLRLALAIVFPHAGGSFVDPDTHAAIVRVTDAHDGARCVHAYATWSPMNADDTRLLVVCDDVPLLFRVDPATDKVTRDGALGARVQPEGAIWSRTDPDLLYALDAHHGTALRSVDVAHHKTKVVHDFARELPAGTFPAQLDASADARVFTFSTRDAANHKLDVWAWDGVSLQRFPRGDRAVDESAIDPSGRRVLVSFADDGRALWDLSTGDVVFFKMSGHYALGADFLVGDDGVGTGVMRRGYGAADAPQNLVAFHTPDGKLDWTICDHLSMRDERFAIVSTYGPAPGRILLLSTAGDVAPALLAHTFSTGTDYYAQPRAALDYQDRYVVWTSDLGSADRLDVLLLRLPASASGRTP